MARGISSFDLDCGQSGTWQRNGAVVDDVAKVVFLLVGYIKEVGCRFWKPKKAVLGG